MQIAISLGCARALLVLIAFPASALELSYKATSASSADAAWAKVGDFLGRRELLSGIEMRAVSGREDADVDDCAWCLRQPNGEP